MALNSKTTLKIIDALCEGPIEGLVEKRKSIFLNETLMTGNQLNNGTVIYRTKEGTKNQKTFDADSSFSDQQTSIIDVNEEVGQGYTETVNENNEVTSRDYGKGQVTRAINETNVDFVELVFTIPRLYSIASEGLARGQLFFAQIKLQISVAGADGVWNDVDIKVESLKESGVIQKNVIKGICTSPYQFKTQAIFMDTYANGKGPYKIRVKKVEFDDKEDAFEISYEDFQDLPANTPVADKRADSIIWNSIVVGNKFGTAYPFTACVSLDINSSEYQSLPARAYEIKGMKVKIPSGATVRGDDKRGPGSLKFDSSIPFDGSLQENRAWTTCPVCCFYDMLTNTRYGAGDFIDKSNLNWVDLIEISKYCNEIVTNPDGTEEARFAINTVIGSQTEAYNLLQDMASIFRGMLFWKADNVQIAADHGELGDNDPDAPKNVPAIHVFSNSNVVDGSFSYSGSSLKTRSTRVRVRYNDPDNFYKPDFVVVEDIDLVNKYGIQEKSIVAFGCTSRHQAQRMARWVMQSEKLHDDTVTFSVGLEGLNVLPGQVFEISDQMRVGVRLAGRIVGARRSLVRIDYQPVLFDDRTDNIDTWNDFDTEDVYIPSGSSNRISVVMKDGTIETSTITSVSGNTINVSPKFTQVPPDDALYAIKSDSLVLPKYRCLSVSEGEAGVYSIVGVRHVDGIYRVVEGRQAKVELVPPFFYGASPEPPTNLQITYQNVNDGRNTINRATISWTRGLIGNVAEYHVRYKFGGGGNWIEVNTNNTSIDVTTGLVPGKNLIAQVKAVGLPPNSISSAYTDKVTREIPAANISILGEEPTQGTSIIVDNLPPDPEELTIETVGVDQVILNWSPTANGQNLESFVAVIRHSSKTDGTGTWADSVLMRKVEARTTSAVLPLLNGEYFVKFQNDQNNRSLNAASVLINVPDPIPRFNFEVVREDASPGEFPGDKNKVYYSDIYDGLVLDGDASFDEIADLDGFTENIDTYLGTQFTKGTYYFEKIIDLGAKFSVRMQRVLTARGLYTSDLIDDRAALIDTWTDFDGDIPDDTSVEVYFRKSDLAATASDAVNEDGDKILLEDSSAVRQESDLAFDEWIPLENNVYAGRSFQFKAVLKTDHIDQTPIVDQLGVTMQFERRSENSGTIASGTDAGGKTVTFDNAFYVDADTKVGVGITAFDLSPGDYYVLSEPTGTGFTVTFKNGSTVIDRNFQYTAIGHGTQQT